MLTHCFFSRHFYCPYSLNPFIPLFLIICHNLLSSFPFTISSSQNLITPLRSNHLPCRLQKVIVLPTVKGKRLPPTIRLPKPWVKRLSIPNRTIPRSRKGVAMRVVKCYLQIKMSLATQSSHELHILNIYFYVITIMTSLFVYKIY